MCQFWCRKRRKSAKGEFDLSLLQASIRDAKAAIMAAPVLGAQEALQAFRPARACFECFQNQGEVGGLGR